MQAIKTPVLADSYPLQPRITEGYEPFFTGLLGFCADATIDEALAARIKTYVQGWLATHPLNAFDRFSDESYLRTYLGRCPRTHWEAIVMSWKAGNRTSIHAHPQFAGYYFADGEFQVEIFEQAGPTALKLANVVRVNGQEGFAAIGLLSAPRSSGRTILRRIRIRNNQYARFRIPRYGLSGRTVYGLGTAEAWNDRSVKRPMHIITILAIERSFPFRKADPTKMVGFFIFQTAPPKSNN